MTASEILSSLVNKGVLVSPELFEKEIDENILKNIIKENGDELDILDEELINDYTEKTKSKNHPGVKIIKSYDKPPKKRTFQDFVSVFNMRFNNISNMLKYRQEMQGITSISRVKSRNQNEKVAVVGMVLDKNITKNNSIILKLEDITGTITAVITNHERNKNLHSQAQDIVLDEVIGITGNWSGSTIFPDKIIHPDIPLSKELKKQPDEEYVVFMGDTHFGSKEFMTDEFQKFIDWIRGESGNDEQRNIAKKTKYLILSGDIVEGVGIYPSQEQDLAVIDIHEQYKLAADWLKQIPEHIEIIVMSGNHDAGRLSEPQERPFKDMAGAIWDMKNVTLVSNPAYVKIGVKENFAGFDLLLYHGGSLIYYADNIPSIRAAGGQKRSDLIMKFLLQRRHLAPTHGSTLYLPDPDEDFLLIDIVPDFFITGHIHRSSAANYRNITMINSSCWTETTEDQIKRGLEPLPARVPVVNLKTRNVKMINFLTKKSKEKEKEVLKVIEDLKDKKENANNSNKTNAEVL